MFLIGTLLNVAAVVAGTTIGVLAGTRLPPRLGEALTTGIGLFVAVLAVNLASTVFTDSSRKPGDEIAILAGLLAGVSVGELTRLHDRLEGLGAWFQQRLAAEPVEISGSGTGDTGGSRIAEAFLTASLVYCIGPLTILGPLDNGLRGDTTLLSIKSLLDGVASIAFAAALGPGVYLSAITVFVVQGSIAAGAFLLRDVADARTIMAVTSTGGLILVGVALRLLDLKAVRVTNFLPALVLAPLFLRIADAVRGGL